MLTTTTRGEGRPGQGAKQADAVQVRHQQIERHDIGRELRDLLDRVEPVARDADDLDLGIGRQDLAHDLPREGRVVDHEHPDPSDRPGHAAGLR
ncbi:MAG TPA: hypothetical protein VII82_06040 [Polyangiaceae bacterium]